MRVLIPVVIQRHFVFPVACGNQNLPLVDSVIIGVQHCAGKIGGVPVCTSELREKIAGHDRIEMSHVFIIIPGADHQAAIGVENNIGGTCKCDDLVHTRPVTPVPGIALDHFVFVFPGGQRNHDRPDPVVVKTKIVVVVCRVPAVHGAHEVGRDDLDDRGRIVSRIDHISEKILHAGDHHVTEIAGQESAADLQGHLPPVGEPHALQNVSAGEALERVIRDLFGRRFVDRLIEDDLQFIGADQIGVPVGDSRTQFIRQLAGKGIELHNLCLIFIPGLTRVSGKQPDLECPHPGDLVSLHEGSFEFMIVEGTPLSQNQGDGRSAHCIPLAAVSAPISPHPLERTLPRPDQRQQVRGPARLHIPRSDTEIIGHVKVAVSRFESDRLAHFILGKSGLNGIARADVDYDVINVMLVVGRDVRQGGHVVVRSLIEISIRLRPVGHIGPDDRIGIAEPVFIEDPVCLASDPLKNKVCFVVVNDELVAAVPVDIVEVGGRGIYIQPVGPAGRLGIHVGVLHVSGVPVLPVRYHSIRVPAGLVQVNHEYVPSELRERIIGR